MTVPRNRRRGIYGQGNLLTVCINGYGEPFLGGCDSWSDAKIALDSVCAWDEEEGQFCCRAKFEFPSQVATLARLLLLWSQATSVKIRICAHMSPQEDAAQLSWEDHALAVKWLNTDFLSMQRWILLESFIHYSTESLSFHILQNSIALNKMNSCNLEMEMFEIICYSVTQRTRHVISMCPKEENWEPTWIALNPNKVIFEIFFR